MWVDFGRDGCAFAGVVGFGRAARWLTVGLGVGVGPAVVGVGTVGVGVGAESDGVTEEVRSMVDARLAATVPTPTAAATSRTT